MTTKAWSNSPQPSSQPSGQPTSQPSSQPIGQPLAKPSRQLQTLSITYLTCPCAPGWVEQSAHPCTASWSYPTFPCWSNQHSSWYSSQ